MVKLAAIFNFSQNPSTTKMVVDVNQKRIDNFRGQKMVTEVDQNFSNEMNIVKKSLIHRKSNLKLRSTVPKTLFLFAPPTIKRVAIPRPNGHYLFSEPLIADGFRVAILPWVARSLFPG